MRTLFRMALSAGLALALAVPVSAQETGQVAGQVIQATTGAPVEGAQVVIRDTRRGTITNQDGRFLFVNVPAGTVRVQVINLGFAAQTETVTVRAGETTQVDFALAVSAIELDALVVNAVTGQVEQRRSLGTNVGNINVAEEIEPTAVQTLSDVLNARVAGVNLQDVNGSTGTSSRIRIRGANSLSLSNEPLIYVDGIRVSDSQSINLYTGGQDPSRLNDITPQDIESIEILKGPAASALYGTAAANGVIVITTKRGRPGTARYNAYVEYGTIEEVTDYPTNYFAFQQNVDGAELTPENWLLAVIGLNRQFGLATDPFEPITACTNVEAAAGSCRQDAVGNYNSLMDPRTRPFRDGNREKWGLSVAGGSENLTYYISGDLEQENGIFSTNQLDKANVRANLNANITERFSLGVNTGYVSSTLDINPNDNHVFSPLINGLMGTPVFIPADAFEEVVVGGINFGDLDASGENKDQVNRWNHIFFVNQQDIEAFPTTQEVERFTSSVNANYRPRDWLSANVTMGLDYTTRHDFQTLQRPDDNSLGLDLGGDFSLGYRSSTRIANYAWTGSGSVAGRFDLTDDLRSTTTVGASYQRDLTESTQCYGANLVPGLSSCGATTTSFFVNEGFFEVVTIGGFVRQELAWRDRLFFGASLRGDDNSAFGTGADLIYYPSASVSWVIAEEDFFPRTDILSDLRLRAAYGESGLRPGFRQAQTLFAPVSVTGETGDLSGVTISSTGNPSLRAERSREWELGFDAGLLNGRVGVEFTYYDKESEDALVARPLPPSLGFTNSVFQNLGSVSNSGTELSVNALVFQAGDVALNMRGSWTTLDNEINTLGEGIEPIVFNRGFQQHKEGFSAGSFHMQEIAWNDADGNGLLGLDEVFVTTDTAVFQGPSMPTWTWNLSADLQVTEWLQVRTNFDGKGGHYQLNQTADFRCGISQAVSSWWGGCDAVANPDASLEEQAGHIANWFGGLNVDENMNPTGGRSATVVGYLEEADFVKWRELSVTLSAPRDLAQSWPALSALSGISLTVSGRNLKTWTDYGGLDPEINETGGSSNFTQSEFNTQPPVRYFTARVNVRF